MLEYTLRDTVCKPQVSVFRALMRVRDCDCSRADYWNVNSSSHEKLNLHVTLSNHQATPSNSVYFTLSHTFFTIT